MSICTADVGIDDDPVRYDRFQDMWSNSCRNADINFRAVQTCGACSRTIMSRDTGPIL